MESLKAQGSTNYFFLFTSLGKNMNKPRKSWPCYRAMAIERPLKFFAY
jgi:hypothetical protein